MVSILIAIISLASTQITKLQEQWLELHACVDYNALLTIMADCVQVGFGLGEL